MELSPVVNEGEDAASWVVTAALSIASVLREVAGETLLQHVLGESLGLLEVPGPDTAAEVQSCMGGDLEIVTISDFLGPLPVSPPSLPVCHLGRDVSPL